MSLRVVAVAAPDWIAGTKDSCALNSRIPASLFNACRQAALATGNRASAWSRSNWVGSRQERRDRTLLMYSLEDMPEFEALLRRERPNLVLIGAMTLCLPGAVACARMVRAILGDRTVIVLGGRHVSETVYIPAGDPRRPECVRHHPGSPLRLMAMGRIDRVFDLVVAGDGEHLIEELGEAVASAERDGVLDLVPAVFDRLDKGIPGTWIAGTLNGDTIRTVVGTGVPIEYGALPSPTLMFGVAGGFDVFGGRVTAHAYSDTGRGCVYDCAFCSERSSVTGGLRDPMNAAERLHRQFAEICSVVAQDHPGRGASAFVEDSVILGGSPRLIDDLAVRLEAAPLDIAFGAQLTIDQILTRQDQIARLARVGLRYVFVGIETLIPETIGGMSKDLGRRRQPWLARIHQALEVLEANGVACGCAVLFGLGERQEHRIDLLDALWAMRRTGGMPDPISANWAVQHPLCGDDGGADYDYIQWGTPEGPFLDLFHRFGEASLLYPLPHAGRPRLDDVREVTAMLDAMRAPASDRHAVPAE